MLFVSLRDWDEEEAERIIDKSRRKNKF